MILGRGNAPGKVILFGEHAVVYGRPALAAPVTQVEAQAVVESAAAGAGTTIVAEDIGEQIRLCEAAEDHPLAAAVRLTLAHLDAAGVGFGHEAGGPDWRIIIRSTIPIASGMGSGAAVSTAIVRAVVAANQQSSESTNQQIGKSAVAQHAIRNTQCAIAPAAIAALVFEIEKLHHGTPSGIDNTVIAFGQPVYFVRGQLPQPFAIGRSFTLAIADTGIRSPTKVTVGEVRKAWQARPETYERLFDHVAAVAEAARSAIADGRPDALGPLMDRNHALLQEIGVSSPELDALVVAARSAGALGAKLSGGGGGGNMIAFVTDEAAPQVAKALWAAGATRVIVTRIGA